MTCRHVVKVICGANDDRLPVVGCRVGTIRNSLVDAFNLPSQALAFVNGVEVGPSFRVQAHNVLEFCKKHGYKGAGGCSPRPGFFRNTRATPTT